MACFMVNGCVGLVISWLGCNKIDAVVAVAQRFMPMPESKLRKQRGEDRMFNTARCANILRWFSRWVSAQRHGFDVPQAAAKETLTDAVEAQRDVADAITVAGRLAVVMTQQVGSGERLRGACSGGRGGID